MCIHTFKRYRCSFFSLFILLEEGCERKSLKKELDTSYQSDEEIGKGEPSGKSRRTKIRSANGKQNKTIKRPGKAISRENEAKRNRKEPLGREKGKRKTKRAPRPKARRKGQQVGNVKGTVPENDGGRTRRRKGDETLEDRSEEESGIVSLEPEQRNESTEEQLRDEPRNTDAKRRPKTQQLRRINT